MKMNYKKSLKFITLLITSLLIATVSASTYYNMEMKATPISVVGNKIQFWPGADFDNASGSINTPRTEVTFTGMEGYAGAIANYSDPVKINNTDTVNSHTIELKLKSWDAIAETPLHWINITMYDAAGNPKGDTIKLIPGGGGVTSSGDVTIPVSEVFRVEWLFKWKDTAEPATDKVNVVLELIVKS